MQRDEKKLYRFALYGRSGSGKSCLLGALAVAGSSIGIEGDVLTCERLPVEVPASMEGNTPRNSESAKSDYALALVEGKKWIDEVVQALENRELPRATPPTERPFAVDFRIADPKTGEIVVRLIDYSGELINPDAEAEPESLARKLKQRLAELDGLLILAEAPRRNQQGTLAKEIRLLREAFMSLRQVSKDPVRTPVGILITKWDHYSDINFDNPQTERLKLEQLLKEHREYKDLAISVRTAILDQEEAVKFGSQENLGKADHELSTTQTDFKNNSNQNQSPRIETFHMAPVSAFGKSTLLDGKEIFADRLQPFNGLAPLVWLALRKDDLELRTCLSEWQRYLRWWFIPFWFGFPKVRKLHGRTSLLSNRMAQRSPLRATLSGLQRRVNFLSTLSVIVTFVFMAFLGELGITSWHVTEYYRASLAVDNPATRHEDLASHRSLLEAWPNRIYTGLLTKLLVPEDWRKNVLNSLNQKLENVLWNRFTNASGVKEKVEAAKDYLRLMPTGPHAVECQRYLDETQWKERVAANRESLDKLKAEWPRSELGESVRKYKQKVDAFQWPHPDAVTEELTTKLTQFREEIRKWFIDREFTNLNNIINQHLAAGRLTQAIQDLLSQSPDLRKEEKWAELVQRTLERIPNLARESIRADIEAVSFTEAVQKLNTLYQRLKDLEGELRKERNGQSAEVCLATQREILKIENDVKERWDRYLYEQCVFHQSEKACERYLESAPLQVMERHVRAYKRYLEQLQKPLTAKVELSVWWDPDGRSDFPDVHEENDISVTVNTAVVARFTDVNSVFHEYTRVGTFELRCDNADTELKIEMRILEIDEIFHDFNGSGQKTCSLRELREGIEIPLRGAGFENRARLKIVEGWPQEPELPPWSR